MGMNASFFRVSKYMLETIITNIDDIDELLFDSEQLQDIELYIDKSWHGIYFLLTGEANIDSVDKYILGQAILGGEEIGEDLGYGPLRYLESSKVIEISHELSKISVDDLSVKFDLEKLNKVEIYPSNGSWTIEDKDYLVENYAELVNFYKLAASQEEAVLLYLN